MEDPPEDQEDRWASVPKGSSLRNPGGRYSPHFLKVAK